MESRTGATSCLSSDQITFQHSPLLIFTSHIKLLDTAFTATLMWSLNVFINLLNGYTVVLIHLRIWDPMAQSFRYSCWINLMLFYPDRTIFQGDWRSCQMLSPQQLSVQARPTSSFQGRGSEGNVINKKKKRLKIRIRKFTHCSN